MYTSSDILSWFDILTHFLYPRYPNLWSHSETVCYFLLLKTLFSLKVLIIFTKYNRLHLKHILKLSHQFCLLQLHFCNWICNLPKTSLYRVQAHTIHKMLFTIYFANLTSFHTLRPFCNTNFTDNICTWWTKIYYPFTRYRFLT